MANERVNLERPWFGFNPSCPEFVPQQQQQEQQPSYVYNQYNQPPPRHPPQTMSYGWIPRGQNTWQHDVFSNRVVGGYFPRIRTKGAYLYDLDAVPFDPNIDVSIKVCFNCWQQGHQQQKCTQPKTHVFCDNCGRVDVYVNECPRCARAYNRYLLEKQARKEMGMHADDGDYEEEGLEEPFEMEDNMEQNEKSDKKSTMSSVASQTTEEGYFSLEGSENFDDIIFDENLLSPQDSTSVFLKDFMVLMDRVKMFPMETQNDVVQQFLAERRLKLKDED